jgi:hypothetical protein
LRIPTKPATHSNRKPATDSDLKPAIVPISSRPPAFASADRGDDDLLEGIGQAGPDFGAANVE